ncbi:alpha-N-arabinofuranosidase [Paenibacillus odorifer]|jgi:GH43 family beta-xylosidase|uniref:Alpha-N-arabinofuranosidase n=1 Tax=Paenibacillus odorifer TaxID=189426 RepID=A0ABX3GMW8_9BACL|nr:family 43 glycosylhydrolase [Paenibacillus odorifer]OMC65131.1 alpha-N-arabinofuranosidase [Paenibacillus odorifer]OMC79808.1 alpha-N-arabinofuranosidase [Paenibacillus odorifer]OMD33623.1 alpha-N-arabinofuranosidase [Paenibacillus odorifer]OMD65796.1 alpha-N-arabinofuranosidase [Paenibacillus odorifer]OMD79770.1 alpha-N-arabinofuranosidase [Paenibacillus odorifer]
MGVQQEELRVIKPLIEQRADPFICRHSDGYYYFVASVPEYNRIEIRRAQDLVGLITSAPVVIWRKRETGILSANIWAPELHFIDGKWYVYFAAAHTSETTEGLFDHRMYVLENENANPLEGSWTERGQVRTAWESFSLDATTFEHNGSLYYVWAQKDPEIEGNSNLYISKMSNPWTLIGAQTMITMPEYDWEIIGYKVNEGAAFVRKDNRVFLTYSASATDFNYCMGLLEADADSDLLDAASWRKSKVPVLTTDESISMYGPGHNSFTVSETGEKTLFVFHARTYKHIVGDPLYDPNRHTFVAELLWTDDGRPDFRGSVAALARSVQYE